jgi:hypothetical protein
VLVGSPSGRAERNGGIFWRSNLISKFELWGIRFLSAAFPRFVCAHLQGYFAAPVAGWEGIAGTGAGATIAATRTSHMGLSPCEELSGFACSRESVLSSKIAHERTPQCSC